MNKIIIIGRLTNDIEMNATKGGLNTGKTTIAFNNKVKQGNEWIDKATFIEIRVFGNTATYLSKYSSKGSKIAIEGKLFYDSWEYEGKKYNKHYIICDSVELLDSKESNNSNYRSNDNRAVSKHKNKEIVVDDDDIPF